jgi:hypothetical protein
MYTKKNLLYVAILIILIGGSIVLYKRAYPATSAETQKETQDLVEKVGKLIMLPQDEEPTVATVSDVDKLKDQPFFAKASNGDKVLLYSTAQKAYLYDPEANKILEVAPINFGTKTSTTAQ